VGVKREFATCGGVNTIRFQKMQEPGSRRIEDVFGASRIFDASLITETMLAIAA
jgi:hypothetical protein